jgi:hypothetical protein
VVVVSELSRCMLATTAASAVHPGRLKTRRGPLERLSRSRVIKHATTSLPSSLPFRVRVFKPLWRLQCVKTTSTFNKRPPKVKVSGASGQPLHPPQIIVAFTHSTQHTNLQLQLPTYVDLLSILSTQPQSWMRRSPRRLSPP